MAKKTAVIIGAGPAGLTAAYELLCHSDIKPIVVEVSPHIGGLSKTLEYKGNRIDLGGHRFFSKSGRVREWWLNLFPLETSLKNRGDEQVMLLRERHSRIYFLRKLFDYPLSPSIQTVSQLGIQRFFKIVLSYLQIRLFPVPVENNLEDFFINRFGKELYETFFKDYTEKVWGVPCTHIKPEWGSQRVKGLSILKAVCHGLAKLFQIPLKNTETSLIESFWYPKYGPGQLWEYVAKIVQSKGGEVYLNTSVEGLVLENGKIETVEVFNCQSNEKKTFRPDYVFSSMPIKDLIASIQNSPEMDEQVKAIAEGLQYRDFITVGILLKQLRLPPEPGQPLIQDNWLYIQEKDVRVGRIQLYNNWSPDLVADQDTVWLGLEYFCNENDIFWTQPDESLIQLALDELSRLGIANAEDYLDGVVIRVPKAYPAYWGTYEQLDTVKTFLNGIENLMVIGRNGMHKYNNSDHSMLTAMVAVDQIVSGNIDKEAIWQINTEQEYHETINDETANAKCNV